MSVCTQVLSRLGDLARAFLDRPHGAHDLARHLAALLGLAAGRSLPIAVLCIGHVAQFYDRPMLEAERWDLRRPLAGMLYEDSWGNAADAG